MSEKFCLKWKDFPHNTSRSFSNLREEDNFHDVTIVCDDLKQLGAHKVILSSGSEYFKSIFNQNKHSHSHLLLCLSDISSYELEQVLDFLYLGEVNVFQEQLHRFLNIGMRLKLEGLLKDQKHSTLNETGSMKQGTFFNEEILVSIDKNQFSTPELKIQSKVKQSTLNETGSMKQGTPFNEEILMNIDQNQFDNPELQIQSKVSVPENSSFEEVETLVTSYLIKHDNGLFACSLCGKFGTKHRGDMKNHIETHLDGVRFSCPVCEKNFR